jgi:hypothetical protein
MKISGCAAVGYQENSVEHSSKEFYKIRKMDVIPTVYIHDL